MWDLSYKKSARSVETGPAATWGNAAGDWLETGLEAFHQYQCGGIVAAVAKMDIGLEHVVFRPRMKCYVRVAQQDGAGHAVGFELEKGMAGDLQMQFFAEAQANALQCIRMAQPFRGLAAIVPLRQQVARTADTKRCWPMVGK
jgi:hypothetical protein